MSQNAPHLTMAVRDYIEAIAYFTQILGFQLVEDKLPAKASAGR